MLRFNHRLTLIYIEMSFVISFSALRPWDLAAGKILAETLDLVVETIDVKETNMLSSKVVLVATKNAEKDITKLIFI